VQQESLTDEEEVKEKTVRVEVGLEGNAAQSNEEGARRRRRSWRPRYRKRSAIKSCSTLIHMYISMPSYIFVPELLDICNLPVHAISISEYMKPTILIWKCNPAARIVDKIHGNGKNYYSLQSLYQNSSEIQDCYKNYIIHIFH